MELQTIGEESPEAMDTQFRMEDIAGMKLILTIQVVKLLQINKCNCKMLNKIKWKSQVNLFKICSKKKLNFSFKLEWIL